MRQMRSATRRLIGSTIAGQTITPEDVALARAHQEAQRRIGQTPQSIRDILSGIKPRTKSEPQQEQQRNEYSGDFYKGNFSVSKQYIDTVREAIDAREYSLAHKSILLNVLMAITYHMKWESYECSQSGADLARYCGINQSNMVRYLSELESLGAIHRRATPGTTRKTILLNPDGAYRGRLGPHGPHATATAEFAAEVLSLDEARASKRR